MQPRDLHRPPKSTSPVVSCLQGSCLLLVLGLVYGALRAQPAEGPTVVYEHTPALRPVPGTSHVEARNEPTPRVDAEVRPVAPMPVPRAVAEATPPPQEDGPGRSLPAVRPRGSQAGATGLASAPSLGLRTRSPLPVSPVYLDHLSYMEKHPGNGKAATVDSWKAGVGGYDRGLGSRQAELLAIAFQSGPHRHRTAPAPPPHRPRTAPAPFPHAAADSPLRQAGAMPTLRRASRRAAPPASASPRPPCSPATPGTSATGGAPPRARVTAASASPRSDDATARATGGARRVRYLCSPRWRGPSASTAGTPERFNQPCTPALLTSPNPGP